MLEKGVVWQLGKVFFRDAQVYQFNLQPEGGHKMPAFINLQQYYVEEFLVDRIGELPLVDLRWKNRVTRVESRDDGARVEVETPDGTLCADVRLPARRRRREQSGARVGRRGRARAGVSRSVSDLRHLDARRLSDGALVLVRSAVSSGAFGIAASAAGQRLARRLPDRRRRGRGPGAAHREHPAAHRRNARCRNQMGTGVGERIHVPLSQTGSAGARTRAVHRRFGASGVAVRCTRRQRRGAGCGESGVETRAGDPRRSAA